MTSWKQLIQEAMSENGETFSDTVACTLSDEELVTKFDDGYGTSEGRPFTLWTKKNVYFPVVYDGLEWVGFAPRNPVDKPMHHWGGQ